MPRIKKNTLQNRKGVPSGAPETLENTDRSKVPSLQGVHAGGVKKPPLRKDGQPLQAFAIVPDPKRPEDWQLPHHTLHVLDDIEGSVDWLLVERATLLLSLQGDEGRRVTADPALIIEAARHITGHYRNAGKPIPTALCVLI